MLKHINQVFLDDIYEKEYFNHLYDIMYGGFADGVNERTGVATKRLPGIIFRIDVAKEFPILRSKKVYWKSAIHEILWIMQKQSDNIHDLKPHIWDEWADENGSIGKSYGYQVGKPVTIKGKTYESQVHYVLDTLAADPTDRRCVITLWNVEDLNEMNLVPCCHTSTWNLDGGRLNCVLDQRSGDFPYGVPFNTTQYAALMVMFAQHLSYVRNEKIEPGILTHVIADAHIYDRQYEGVKKQIAQFKYLYNGIFNEELTDKDFDTYSKENDANKIVASKPELIVPLKNFFELTIDDIELRNYESMPKVDFGDVVV